jgi:DNA-binding response OmpR family regulator
LVVEDDAEAAGSFALLLRLDGHQVCTAAHGYAALAVATAFRPQAVLLDIGLPGMNGYAVARGLRRQPGLENVLIIAVTGREHPEDKREALNAGFNLYLVKPLGLAKLKLLLSRLRRW